MWIHWLENRGRQTSYKRQNSKYFRLCKPYTVSVTFSFSFFFLIVIFYLFIYFYNYFWLCWVFVSVRGLSPVAASGGHPSSWCVGLFTIAASPVAAHRLQTHRLSSCGSRAQPLRGMWDPPRPGPEPVSPALAGRLSTTAPPGKPLFFFFLMTFYKYKNLPLLTGHTKADGPDLPCASCGLLTPGLDNKIKAIRDNVLNQFIKLIKSGTEFKYSYFIQYTILHLWNISTLPEIHRNIRDMLLHWFLQL